MGDGMGLLLDDLADLLSSGGVATTTYRGIMPEIPDDALQLVETGGLAAVHAMSASAGAAHEERPTVQIMRRSPVYNRARAEMNVIWKLLDGLGDRSINGTRYLWIAARQSPFGVGRDETNRYLVACNFDVCKALSTTTST